jgi:hypothetical protein
MPRKPRNHDLAGARHDSDTLADVNSKISDATLIDTADSRLSDARTPTSHNLGGSEHAADTLANLNSKVSDATLIDTADTRIVNRTLNLSGQNFRKGATAPTEVTIGTTPTVPALLFDATAELASTYVRMPGDFDPAVDLTLILTWSLVNSQSDSEVASITLNYVATEENSTGNGADKTSTQVLGTTTVTTGNGLAVNDVYTTSFTIDASDATNPLASANGLGVEIGLTNVTGVAAIHLLDASLEYAVA